MLRRPVGTRSSVIANTDGASAYSLRRWGYIRYFLRARRRRIIHVRGLIKAVLYIDAQFFLTQTVYRPRDFK